MTRVLRILNCLAAILGPLGSLLVMQLSTAHQLSGCWLWVVSNTCASIVFARTRNFPMLFMFLFYLCTSVYGVWVRSV